MVEKRLLALAGLFLMGGLAGCTADQPDQTGQPDRAAPAVTVTRTVESSAIPLPDFTPEQQEVVDGIRELYFGQVCESLRDGIDVTNSVASASRGVTMFTVEEHAQLHATAIGRDCPEFDHLVPDLVR